MCVCTHKKEDKINGTPAPYLVRGKREKMKLGRMKEKSMPSEKKEKEKEENDRNFFT